MNSQKSLLQAWSVWLLLLTLSSTLQVSGQIGYIYDPAVGSVLDPNGDNYISSSGTAIDTALVADESFVFEYPFIPFFHLSIEPIADLLTGSTCGKSEIVDNPNLPMHAGFWCLTNPNNIPNDGDEALIFRMRIARNVTGAYGYSILMDTDHKMGFTGPDADPNAIPGNPGFELEVLYVTSGAGTVSILDVDGTLTGSVMSNYSGTTNTQKSHAGFTNCPLASPIFLDFYVPYDSLGIAPTDTVRMLFATSSSGTSVLGGSASDIGGVIDNNYSNTDSTLIVATDSSDVIVFGSCGWALTKDHQNVSCNGAGDGSAWVHVSGGIPPISYAWSNGATTDSVSNLTPGPYQVIITSGVGCSDTLDVTISEPSPLTGYISVLDSVSCFGQLSGALAGWATGGTLPYSYAWSNGFVSDTIVNLGVGSYSLIVTDAKGCSDSIAVEMNGPSAALNTAIQSKTDVLCRGDNSGAIDLQISGGTPPYSVLWNDGSVDSMRTSLSAGIYEVVVSDANSCVDSLQVEVTQPTDSLSASVFISQPILCFGDLGTGYVNVSGGVAPYLVSWSNGSLGDTISGLAKGMYSVLVTDANGCSDSASFELTEPDPLTISFNTSDVSCFGGSNGTARVIVSGGTSPYTYDWNTGSTQDSLFNLMSGVYSVVITDANGCMDTASITITEPQALSVNSSSSDVLCHGGSDGSVGLTVNGGTSPYSYLWSNNRFHIQPNSRHVLCNGNRREWLSGYGFGDYYRAGSLKPKRFINQCTL